MRAPQPTGRWRVAVGTAVTLAGVGIWLDNAVLLAAAMAPVVFVGASAVTTVVSPNSLTITRSVTPQQSYPGGTAAVELTITNETDQLLSDLRVVDGVPAELAVIEGSPRAALRLGAGDSATLNYTIRLRYGEFTFTPVTARTQDLSGTRAHTAEQRADGDDTIVGRVDLAVASPTDPATDAVGSVQTNEGGEGLEFHSIRSYQPSDPIRRINWRQYARDRTLSTVDYKRQESTEVLLIVDVRPETWVAPDQTTPTGAESAVQAAAAAASNLLNARHKVGGFLLGGQLPEAENGRVWIPPTQSRATRARLEAALDAAATPPGAEAASQQTPVPAAEAAQTVIEQLSRNAQVLIFSPLIDEYPVTLCRKFQQFEYSARVYAPAVTARDSLGGTVETAAHTLRVRELRSFGTPVTTWPNEQPLAPSAAGTGRGRENKNKLTTTSPGRGL